MLLVIDLNYVTCYTYAQLLCSMHVSSSYVHAIFMTQLKHAICDDLSIFLL